MSETPRNLAQDYFHRAQGRYVILGLILRQGLYADVVREAQELVELALKGLLRKYAIDPPKVHDVGPVLLQYKALFPEGIRQNLPQIAAISLKLRKEREVSFYGDEDLVPSSSYGIEDAQHAHDAAGKVIEFLKQEFES